MPKKSKRGRGEGGVYQRKSDGLWVGSVSLGEDVEGKRIRKMVYAKTKKEAQEKLLKIQQDALNGLPVSTDKITVHQHFEDWFRAKKATVRKSTFENYKTYYEAYIKPVFGGLKLKNLDYRRINALYENLDEKGGRRQEGLSKRTVAYIAYLLKSALDDAVRKGIIQTNPAKLAAKRTQDKKEARCLNQDEMSLFLDAARGERLEDALILALQTGLRPGEWLGLSWDAIDWKKKQLTVKQALCEQGGQVWLDDKVKTKAGRRTISLSSMALAALKRQKKRQIEDQLAAKPKKDENGNILKDEDGNPIRDWENPLNLVFTNKKGGPLRRSNIDDRDLRRVLKVMAEKVLGDKLSKDKKRDAREVIREAGLAGITLHTFRHTHASILIFQGVDVKTISRRLGHENVSFTLQVYGHLLPGQDERAADQIEAFFKTL